MSNFKQVGDKSLADINAANRDTWGGDATAMGKEEKVPGGHKITIPGTKKPTAGGILQTPTITHTTQTRTGAAVSKVGSAFKKFFTGHDGADALTHPGGAGGEAPRLHHQSEHDDFQEMPKTPNKSVREKQFSSEPRDWPEQMTNAVKRDKEGRESLGGEGKDRAIHLPRTAKKTWKKGTGLISG